MDSRNKVLFIAEGVTLAHVGRTIRLASMLHDHGIASVELACDDRYASLVADLPYAVHSIRSIAPESFLRRLAHGRSVFSADVLADYVRDDIDLLERTRADLVVGDFRLSLSVSARLARIPYVNVTNAYWSPFAKPRFRLPGLPGSHLIGGVLGDKIFSLARPLAFAVHARPLNALRRRHGLPSLGADVRRIYCDGDVTLYADVPELIPVYGAPASHRYIGPVTWSPASTLPQGWEAAFAGEVPIYVSLGSSGPAALLPTVIAGLSELGRPLIVATAGRAATRQLDGNVWAAPYLPGDVIAARVCLVVCNGGSPATQQAFAHGVPVIGIVSNLDQFLNMDYVERFGAGRLMRADRLTAGRMRAAAAAVIADAGIAARARELTALMRRTDVEEVFPAEMRALLQAGRSGCIVESPAAGSSVRGAKKKPPASPAVS